MTMPKTTVLRPTQRAKLATQEDNSQATKSAKDGLLPLTDEDHRRGISRVAGVTINMMEKLGSFHRNMGKNIMDGG